MNKLKMESLDMTKANIERIAELFPQVVTEVANPTGAVDENGKPVLKKAIDFEKLKLVLSAGTGDYVVADDERERYEFTWVGKRQAMIDAATPIRKTLRPCPEESKDWATTENLYIEGDNLEVLKLLQESYLGKVKMIYIDPPYNTGKDFIYKDNFAQNREEYEEELDMFDEEGNKLFQNTETNGRFHSDWCSMIYPRLQLARNLLTDDGVIFISIDDNEVRNLKNICDEVFGEDNCLGIITWGKKRKGSFLSKGIISLTEYCLVYAKNITLNVGIYGGEADGNESQPIIKRTNRISELVIPRNAISTKLDNGVYSKGLYGDDINPVELIDDVEIQNGKNINQFRIKAPFTWSQAMFDEQLSKGATFIINTLNFQIRVYKFYEEGSFKGYGSFVSGVEIKGTNEDAYEELERIFGAKKLFDYSKPVNYIKEFVNGSAHFDKDAIILDFFSGSATTAHSVMQLNAEDGGNRKFIMVQLPEVCDPNSEAAKAGYSTICEIGKERIRRAGEKINKERIERIQKEAEKDGVLADIASLDTGFRVFKLDTTNMKDVYYAAGQLSQKDLWDTVSNIKDDRSDIDLLYGCLLDWGVQLTMPHTTEQIESFTVHTVDSPLTDEIDLVACFDSEVSETVVRTIAKRKPTRALFRDSSFADSANKINVFEIFKSISPDTTVKVI